MRPLACVGDDVRDQVAESVEGAERQVDNKTTRDHNVAAQKLQLLGPAKNPVDTRNDSRARPPEGHFSPRSPSSHICDPFMGVVWAWFFRTE